MLEMSVSADPQPSTTGVHPYRVAWQTRDLDAWAAALAPDVTMHSPVISSPFRGREAAIELFEVLFAKFGDFEIGHELAGDGVDAFFWHGVLGDRRIQGVDLIRTNERGEIAELTV